MTPGLGKQETIYQIGPITWGILKDLGWNMNPSIFVIAPKNGTSYIVGDSLEIEWFDTNEMGTPIYKIDLYNQEGNLVTNFTPVISGKFGTNSIKLAITSDIPSNVNYQIKLVTYGGDSYNNDGYFQIQNHVAPPSAFPRGDKYAKNTPIKLQSNFANGEIYYTKDKSIPTKNSSKFNSDIILDKDFTLTAKVFVGNNESDTMVANYTVNTDILSGTISCGGEPSWIGKEGMGYSDGKAREYKWGKQAGMVFRSFIEIYIESIPQNVVIDNVIFPILRGYKDSIYTGLYNLDYNGNGTIEKYESFTAGTNTKKIDAYWPQVNNSGSDYDYDFTSDKLTAEVKKAYTEHKTSILFGIKAEDENIGKIFWYNPPSYLYFKSYMTINYHYLPGNYLVDQVDKDKNSFGFVGLWNSSKWDTLLVPITKNFPKGTTQNPQYQYFLASQDYKNGTTQKFRDWKDASIINHRKYNITADKDSIIARFDQSNFATVQNYFEGNVNGGKISFKDPWIVDSVDAKGALNRGVNAVFHDSLPAPFNPGLSSLYKGVFLNQGYNSVTHVWTPPYYSVQATSQQDINLGGSLGTRTFYFQNWGGANVNYQSPNSLETPVVFTAENAVASANYKGHFLSNSSSALTNNGQRKVVRDRFGIYHMVYESMNKLWYTKSTTTNMSGAWTPEEKLLDLGDNTFITNPSISIHATVVGANLDDQLKIVCEVKNGQAEGFDSRTAVRRRRK